MSAGGRRRLRWLAALATAGALAGTVSALVPYHQRYGHACERDPADNRIVMLSGEDINPGRHRHELIKEWERRNPGGPSVTLIEISGGSNSEYGEALASQQLGSCRYDILLLDVVWMRTFIDGGYLEPFPDGEFRPDNFLPGPWWTGTGSDGRQYGIPFKSDVGLLFYRRDLMPEPPRNWDELRDRTIENLLPSAKTKVTAGMVTQLADYEGLTVNGMEAIWAAGGTLRVEGRKVVLDDAAVAGLQRLVDETTRTVIHPASTEYQETESLKAFMQSRVLTMRNWPYAYAVLKADPVLRDKVGVTELFAPPGASGGAAVLGGQNLVIPRNALHKEEAREFVRFLTDPRRQCLLFTRSGYVPVRTEVYDRNNTSATACTELWGEPGERADDAVEKADTADARDLRELAGVLDRALRNARPRPAVPDYPAFSRAFHRYLHNAIVGSETVSKPDLERLLTACAGWTPPRGQCP
jgi:multiple sugar transport system substrate-binding protein|nr:MAG: hypothetical protein DIU60_22770 [Actinomycetota bacterium]